MFSQQRNTLNTPRLICFPVYMIQWDIDRHIHTVLKTELYIKEGLPKQQQQQQQRQQPPPQVSVSARSGAAEGVHMLAWQEPTHPGTKDADALEHARQLCLQRIMNPLVVYSTHPYRWVHTHHCRPEPAWSVMILMQPKTQLYVLHYLRF